MKRINRNSVESPSYFQGILALESRRKLFDYFINEAKSLSQMRYPQDRYTELITTEPSVNHALSTLFSNRCSFCETEMRPLEVYRFRPRANATPAKNKSTSHLYYIWLSEAWQNLYLICKGCKPEDQNLFPVLGRGRAPLPTQTELNNFLEREDGIWPSYPLQEKNLLLDPCEDRIDLHLTFDIHGYALGKTKRGRLTINHFNLNRSDLIESRKKVFLEEIEELREALVGKNSRPLYHIRGHKNSGYHSGALQYFFKDFYREMFGNRANLSLRMNFTKLQKLSDCSEVLDLNVDRLKSSALNQITETYDDVYHREYWPTRSPISISINNFKSLENITLNFPKKTNNEKYSPSILILGENAIGKTTILEALALCLMSDNTRNKLKLRDLSKSILNPRYLGSEQNLKRPSSANISVEFERKKKRAISFDINDSLFIEGPPVNLPIFGYGAFRQYGKSPRYYSDHKFIRNLFDSHQRLSNPEKWLLTLSKQNFDMVARALRSVFLVDTEFDVLERADQQIYVVTRTTEEDDFHKMRTPISIVSSGFKSVLATTCEIMQGLMDKRYNPNFNTLEDARGIVLIDEIEANLHPRWKMGILGGLRKALPRVSFIATSHDPLCLRSMEQNEVFVLQRVPGHVANSELPVFTEVLTELPDNRDWTIEQLLTADFFQLRSTEDLETQRKRAEIEDLIAMGERPSENIKVRQYLEEFTQTLPIGNTELHRLVQEALAIYLQGKRDVSKAKLNELRKETKQRLLDALKSSS